MLMKTVNLENLSIDDLWHEQVNSLLGKQLKVELEKIEERLSRLGGTEPRDRRRHPKVQPKHRNKRRFGRRAGFDATV
jgi:hypothetical protein